MGGCGGTPNKSTLKPPAPPVLLFFRLGLPIADDSGAEDTTPCLPKISRSVVDASEVAARDGAAISPEFAAAA